MGAEMCLGGRAKNLDLKMFTPSNDYERAYQAHLNRAERWSKVKPEEVDDQSDTRVITDYEEDMLLRNVHLEDYESRLKRFVTRPKDTRADQTITIKQKHLREAFRGNEYLERMMNDKDSLDHRLLMLDDIFILLEDEDDMVRDLESMEEDPELKFRVDELLLLGLIYCKSEPEVRVTKFY